MSSEQRLPLLAFSPLFLQRPPALCFRIVFFFPLLTLFCGFRARHLQKGLSGAQREVCYSIPNQPVREKGKRKALEVCIPSNVFCVCFFSSYSVDVVTYGYRRHWPSWVVVTFLLVAFAHGRAEVPPVHISLRTCTTTGGKRAQELRSFPPEHRVIERGI